MDFERSNMEVPVVRPQPEEEMVLLAKAMPPAAPQPQQGRSAAAPTSPVTPTAAAGARPAASPATETTETTPGAAVARLADRPAAAGPPPALYILLSALSVLMSAACLALPGLTARMLFRKAAADPLDAQHSDLVRLCGGATMVGAAAATALASRAGWRGLGDRAADLLKLALAGQGLAATLTTVYYARTISPLVFPLMLMATSLEAAVPAWDLLASRGHQGLLRALGRQLAPPRPGRSLLAGAYYLLALLFPAFGFALFYMPWYTLYHFFGYSYGASTFYLAKLAGVADKALIPVASLLLKDAADKGALGSRAARLLNSGLMLAALVHVAVLVPAMAQGGGWMLPVVTTTWILALSASTAGLVVGARPAIAGAIAEAQEAAPGAGAKQD